MSLAIVLLLSVLSMVAAFSTVQTSSAKTMKLSMSAEGFSKSVPFLKKPKNLDGMIVSESITDLFSAFPFCWPPWGVIMY